MKEYKIKYTLLVFQGLFKKIKEIDGVEIIEAKSHLDAQKKMEIIMKESKIEGIATVVNDIILI